MRTRKQNERENVKAPVAANAFTGQEQEQQEVMLPTRLLSKAQVLARVPVTFPTLWAWMRKGKFPRARSIGGKSVWIESEIEAWIATRPVRRLKGDGEAADVT